MGMHSLGAAAGRQPAFATSSSSSSAQSQPNQQSRQQQQQQNHGEHLPCSEPKDIVGTDDVFLHTVRKDELPSKSRGSGGSPASHQDDKPSFGSMHSEPPLEYMSKAKEGSTRKLQESHSRKEEIKVSSQPAVKMLGKQPKDIS